MEFVIVVLLAFIVLLIVDKIVDNYKIGYYERTLELHNIDINHIKNAKLKDVRETNKQFR